MNVVLEVDAPAERCLLKAALRVVGAGEMADEILFLEPRSQDVPSEPITRLEGIVDLTAAGDTPVMLVVAYAAMPPPGAKREPLRYTFHASVS
jgi:hypothetical protein